MRTSWSIVSLKLNVSIEAVQWAKVLTHVQLILFHILKDWTLNVHAVINISSSVDESTNEQVITHIANPLLKINSFAEKQSLCWILYKPKLF